LADWSRPPYPENLTKTHWDKKKSILAKIGGATGIGDELLKVKQLYDDVDWDKIEIGKHLPKGNDFTKKDWERQRDEALKEVAGSLAKFSQELYRLRDLCLKTKKDFEKAKTIPKSDVKLVEGMAETADHLGVSLNKNTMNPIIYDRWQDFQTAYDNMVASLQKNIKGAVAKAIPKIKEMQSEPTAKKFNSVITSAARDITQSIGNVPRFIKAGYQLGVDGNAAAQLFREMTDWANKTPYFDNDVDEETVKDQIGKFTEAVRACAKLAG
jgi:hypothetical protein